MNRQTWIDPQTLLHNPTVTFGDQGTESIEELIDSKYNDCVKEFIDSMTTDGQKAPILIEANKENNAMFYHVANGHHRLAVAIKHGLRIMVYAYRVDSDDHDFIEMWSESESCEFYNSSGHFYG